MDGGLPIADADPVGRGGLAGRTSPRSSAPHPPPHRMDPLRQSSARIHICLGGYRNESVFVTRGPEKNQVIPLALYFTVLTTSRVISYSCPSRALVSQALHRDVANQLSLAGGAATTKYRFLLNPSIASLPLPLNVGILAPRTKLEPVKASPVAATLSISKVPASSPHFYQRTIIDSTPSARIT